MIPMRTPLAPRSCAKYDEPELFDRERWIELQLRVKFLCFYSPIRSATYAAPTIGSKPTGMPTSPMVSTQTNPKTSVATPPVASAPAPSAMSKWLGIGGIDSGLLSGSDTCGGADTGCGGTGGGAEDTVWMDMDCQVTPMLAQDEAFLGSVNWFVVQNLPAARAGHILFRSANDRLNADLDALNIWN